MGVEDARNRLAALADPADVAAARVILDKLDALAARGIAPMELDEAIDILRDQAAERDRRGRAAALVLADYDQRAGTAPIPPQVRRLP